jgi:hypothetical protein
VSRRCAETAWASLSSVTNALSGEFPVVWLSGSAGVPEKDVKAGKLLHPLVTKPATANGIKSRLDAM